MVSAVGMRLRKKKLLLSGRVPLYEIDELISLRTLLCYVLCDNGVKLEGSPGANLCQPVAV